MLPTKSLQRLWSWWTRKSQKDIQLECLNAARYYEEWEAAAFALDELYGNDLWSDYSHLHVENSGSPSPGDKTLLPSITTIDLSIRGYSI